MEFDASLGSYPLEVHSQWQTLTSLLTEPLVRKLAPVQGGSTIFFTPLPQKHDIPHGLKGEALTRFGLDKSQLLEQLIQQHHGNNANLVLGELQYSFLTFLLGQDYDAFEQWKSLVALLCTCEKALNTRTAFFVTFTETLHAQLLMVPEDFFIDPLSERNFLTVALKAFFELVQDPATPAELASAARRLKQLAEQRFAVSFDVSQLGDEKDEDAPVVVET
jgi:A1 cistron-splicing factor AAR2